MTPCGNKKRSVVLGIKYKDGFMYVCANRNSTQNDCLAHKMTLNCILCSGKSIHAPKSIYTHLAIFDGHEMCVVIKFKKVFLVVLGFK